MLWFICYLHTVTCSNANKVFIYFCCSYFYISIHSRTRAGTDFQAFSVKWVYLTNFNSRTHVGCDNSCFIRHHIILSISIHAPLRGATCIAIIRLYRDFAFQSTHPWGVRHGNLKDIALFEIISIHAPLRGATYVS